MNVVERIQPAAPAGFDYSTLSADLAKDARAIADRIHERNRAARAAILETGRDLLAVKERLGHGHFLAWIEAEFGMSDRTARNYMLAAERFGAKSEIISVLPPAAIYQLAASSTPEATREDVLKRIEAGERLAPAAVEKIVREAKDEARQARELAKLPPAERKKAETRARRSRATKEQRAREAQQRIDKWEAKEARSKAAAAEAADMLRQHLGDALPRFLALTEETWWASIKRALDATPEE